jgi:hypothetical protein
MESQAFDSKAYAVSTLDLIPDDFEADDDELDADWVQYCELSRTLDTEDLMVVVGEAFSTSDLLRSLIDEALANPFRPDERKRLHINDAIRLGEEVARLIAQAQDKAVGMRQVTEVHP